MRVVKKPTTAKKGGKSHRKATAKDHLKIKEKAVHKVIENLLAQMKDMEVAAIRYALKQYLGDGDVDITKVKKVRKENKEGYILCYDGVQLGRIHKQHSVEVVKDMPNFRIVFTPFDEERDIKVEQPKVVQKDYSEETKQRKFGSSNRGDLGTSMTVFNCPGLL